VLSLSGEDVLPFGYKGKRLISNLSYNKIQVEKPCEILYREHLGGMGS
jgi:hypothetical protein